MRRILFLFFLSVAFCVITVSNLNRLVDQQGRQRIFHGINVVVKVPPYLPELTTWNTYNSVTAKDLEYMKSWGLNAIRLGVMWAGVEPSAGNYNTTYLKAMSDLVTLAESYGIHVLVEFHQDILSEKFCGDGVPVWAIPDAISKSFPIPLSLTTYKYNSTTGLPSWQDCAKRTWSTYYGTLAVNQGFGALYGNKYNMRDKFVAYWAKVANTFKGKNNLIGYELINEPWPGNLYSFGLVAAIPGLTELTNLQSFYNLLSNTIRPIDPVTPIAFEPVTWSGSVNSGFTQPPGGAQYANKSILSYHYYNPPTSNFSSYINARLADMKRLKVGGILSEFYVIRSQGVQNIPVMDYCDKNLQGWLGWIYKPFDGFNGLPASNSSFFKPDGTPNTTAISVIVRTYAPIVAGSTVSQFFNTTSKQFVLVYDMCISCNETVIFASKEYNYPNGFSVATNPAGKVSYQIVDTNYIKIAPTATAGLNERITVAVNPL